MKSEKKESKATDPSRHQMIAIQGTGLFKFSSDENSYRIIKGD